MNTWIWLDGKLILSQDAVVPLMTHTLHYGSGAFEGIRCYATPHGPAIFRLTDHVKRLLRSFACFGSEVPWTQEALEEAIVMTVKANNSSSCYIRPLLFFGGESLLLSPRNLSVHCAIITVPMGKYLGHSAIKVGISSVRRLERHSVPIHNKINGLYVNSILACHEVRERGFDEALLLDYEGNVAESSVANIFFVIDGRLVTPPTESVLPGITRDSIFVIAKKLGICVEERTVTVDNVSQATEAFFTGTASEITAIASIDQKKLMGVAGIVTQKIHNAYQNSILGRDGDEASWVTFIEKD